MGWSYSTGEKGVNRVRAFEHNQFPGNYFVEYKAGGKVKRTSLGRCGEAKAKEQAEKVALGLRTAGPSTPTGPVTLGTLFELYLREVTPSKGKSKQEHDHRSAEMFGRYLGLDTEARTLSRREWDRFVRDRRAGAVAPAGAAKRRKLRKGEKELPPRPVRDRAIGYDLTWLRGVLSWATMASDGRGGVLLDRNPLLGLELPREANPRRPTVSQDEYLRLLAVADRVTPLFRLGLILVHETGHRIGAVRQLRWSDVDLAGKRIQWRAETDKIENEHITPLTEEAVAALRAAQRQQQAVGDTWIFPSPSDASQPVSHARMHIWWTRGEKLAELTPCPRRGWHSLRRQFATDLKNIPLKDLCELGGWKDPSTVLKCYMKADEETMRNALEQRRAVR